MRPDFVWSRPSLASADWLGVVLLVLLLAGLVIAYRAR